MSGFTSIEEMNKQRLAQIAEEDAQAAAAIQMFQQLTGANKNSPSSQGQQTNNPYSVSSSVNQGTAQRLTPASSETAGAPRVGDWSQYDKPSSTPTELAQLSQVAKAVANEQGGTPQGKQAPVFSDATLSQLMAALNPKAVKTPEEQAAEDAANAKAKARSNETALFNDRQVRRHLDPFGGMIR